MPKSANGFKLGSNIQAGLNLAWDHPFESKALALLSSCSVFSQNLLLVNLQSLKS